MNMKMVFIPAVITLAVTALRLIGELRHWSARWFSPETGGVIPSGVSWIFGITWLAAIFGAYFAVRLVRAGLGPRSLVKAVVYAALGIVLFLVFSPAVRFLSSKFEIGFPQYLVFVWFFFIAAGLIQYFGWPELFKALIFYAYAARIPVAIVMLFAMMGNWGTHYDYVGMNIPLTGISRYLWLAFFPQLVAWVGFTITLGAVAGVLTLFLVRHGGRLPSHKINRIDVSMTS